MGRTFKLCMTLFTVSMLLVAFFWVRSCTREDHLDISADNMIGDTPTQIQSIKAIGEWEFLSINTEELIDTVRKGFFSDDELSRIYYGTLRIGINMHQVKPGWFNVSGDTVTLTLPAVGLLDQEFIDEARSKPFFESGTWKPQDREAMYQKAHHNMLRQGLTPENLKTAETNAREQIRNLMKAMGYKNVNITFVK